MFIDNPTNPRSSDYTVQVQFMNGLLDDAAKQIEKEAGETFGGHATEESKAIYDFLVAHCSWHVRTSEEIELDVWYGYDKSRVG